MVPPELQRLLQACKESPDEDAPRFVLADWLEEHGQADRGEFVRLQVRLERQDVPAGDEAAAQARTHELYLRHQEEWLGALRRWPGRCSFRRGLLDVRASVGVLADHPPQVIAPVVAPWLETLGLDYGLQQVIGEVVALEALACFTSLDLTCIKLSGTWLERLAGDPRVAHVRRLRLSISGSAKAASEALARYPHLGGLRVLDFGEGMGDGGLQALAGSRYLGNLTTLGLCAGGTIRKGAPALARTEPPPRLARLLWDRVSPGEEGLRHLVRSPLLAEVVEMDLTRADLFATGVGTLGERPDWPRLERLSLARNRMGDAGASALAGVSGLRALRRLDMTDTELSARGLQALLDAPWAGGLERLEVAYNELKDAGAEALAAAPALANLRHLDLNGCKIGPDGVRALANSPHLSRLETLDLNGNTIKDAGLAALAEATGLPSLTSLSLGWTRPSGEGLARLAHSPLARQLRKLELNGNNLRGEDLQALDAPHLAGLKHLCLNGNPIGGEGARILGQARFHGLVRLDLRHCRLGPGSVPGLFQGHGFPALAVLDFYAVPLAEEGRQALLAWPRLCQLAYLDAYSLGDDPALMSVARPVTFRVPGG